MSHGLHPCESFELMTYFMSLDWLSDVGQLTQECHWMDCTLWLAMSHRGSVILGTESPELGL